MKQVSDSIQWLLLLLLSSYVATRAELSTRRKIANLWLFTVFADVAELFSDGMKS